MRTFICSKRYRDSTADLSASDVLGLYDEHLTLSLPGRGSPDAAGEGTLLEGLRHVEREYRIEGFVRDHHILVFDIEGDSTRVLEDQVWSPDRKPGRHISIIEDAPYAHIVIETESSFDVFTGICSYTDDRKKHRVRGMRRHQADIPRYFDEADRFGIARGRTVKDSDAVSLRNHQQIVDRVYGHSLNVVQPRIGSFQNPDGSNVSIRTPREDKHTAVLRDKDFSMRCIYRHCLRTQDLSFRADDFTNGSDISVGVAAKREDGPGMIRRDEDFIGYRIIGHIVNRAVEQRVLSCNRSHRLCATIRQPGECRNLRIAHSVGYQEIFSFGVVSNRVRIAQHGRRFFGTSSADHALGSRIARSIHWEDGGRMIAKIRHPQFVVH